jgi:hypothetical protein
MAVIDLSRRGGARPELHEIIPHYRDACRGSADCFYCGHPMTSPGIQWLGSTGEIWLHPGCVVELTIRLYRDVHEIECRSHLYMTARTTSDLRERLQAEEQRS